ncbi:VOC family protein [Falsirhodobacter sp. 20TX0035]|uniref:VOC family protein n=1 Tax=Falsirhodobacter sp. 20TX0035 TaxID=3022019 RepID=UPI00232E8ABF|nr:VOC family protein [Falsirhodobacter sp. 20TX0035]MDB6453260.1 VOC family protein [Falsirhodobacter sp. 20TX0035]
MTHAPRIGRVTLTVNDLPKMTAFYRDALGLNVLSADTAEALLGADAPLLVLRADPAARRPEGREAGLFHTAFLLPERRDLASWLLHAVGSRLPLAGASDHDVSEALYMHDPEGNGIEVYWDRPRSDWAWTDGIVRMGTYPLDLDALAQTGQRWSGAPSSTTVGHVHLQVGALPVAEEFWTGQGADITHRYPGGTFFGWNGYHHHIATNVWNSRGAVPRSFPSTGLAEVEILGLPAQVTEDPWGTPIRFVS